MFERYTERARRVIFFARYEAAQFGSATIETEHLLLGLTREAGDIFKRFLPNGNAADAIRKEVEERVERREKTTTSMDLPLTPECKRILAHASEEAQRLNYNHIGTEHMVLGILREEKCTAAQVLQKLGMQLQSTRDGLAGEPMPKESEAVAGSFGAMRAKLAEMGVGLFQAMRHNPALPKEGVVPDAETAIRLAEAIWQPLYGAAAIESQKPIKAELKSHIVWIVTGSANATNVEPLSVFILKADGRVLAIGQELQRAKTS